MSEENVERISIAAVLIVIVLGIAYCLPRLDNACFNACSSLKEEHKIQCVQACTQANQKVAE